MFGYVLINKPELKIKDFETYRSYYCGLCHQLGRRHGLRGRLTLNYDMTFLVMLLTDLYDADRKSVKKRCPVHPAKKHESRENEMTEYCADMCLLLSYYKCLDDARDEGKGAKAALLKGKALRVKEKYPEKAAHIEQKLEALSQLEKRKAENPDIDEAARLFGEIMGAIFVYRDDPWKEDLYDVGFYLGKFIYLLDAYDDVEEDLQKGTFNVFKAAYREEGFEDRVLHLLLLMIGECTDAFERLPLIEDVEILRNILYSGVWGKFKSRQAETEEAESQKEEIQIDGSL